MSEYIVTARKWRPMKFDDVIGQSHVTVTLRNAIAADRLAHAYLFSGPRGVGKTTVARLLAKVVNCLHPKENNPDNECEICLEINEGRSFDVLEIDGASNRGVEEIRNLRDSARYAPAKGKYKVYIIDEVHMLTKEAFNALLKTLEEPPSNVLFIFATTELHKVPATIVSRCQRFAFRRIAIHEIIANLKAIALGEEVRIDDNALMLVAKRGDGSLRDAQSIFDQVVSLCGRDITHHQIVEALNVVDQEVYFRVTDLLKVKDTKGGLAIVEELMDNGHDIKEFLGGLTEHLRNLLIAKTTGSTDLIESSDVYRKRYAEEATVFSMVDLLRLLRFINGTENAIRWSAQPRFKLEADIVQMISLPGASDVGDILQGIDDLKKKLSDREGGLSAIELKSRIGGRPAVLSPASLTPTASSPGIFQYSSIQPAGTLPAQSAPPLRSITEAELSARWPELVAEVRKQRMSLGSVLESSTVLGVHGSVMRLGCANEFQASSIKRNQELLSGIIETQFNARLRLEVEIAGLGPSPVTLGEEGVTPSRGSVDREHPIIQAMRRELGAEPL
jgi:DNA polymerase III subunit gamma/tau